MTITVTSKAEQKVRERLRKILDSVRVAKNCFEVSLKGARIRSHPLYGRVTGLQGFILELAGVNGTNPRQELSDDEIIDQMRRTRSVLRRIVNRDFGYDLSAWHNFLMGSEEFKKEYMFRYSWGSISRDLPKFVADPKRCRLAIAAAALDALDDPGDEDGR